MKPGEIWGYTDPKTEKKRGWKVVYYFPPGGECSRHIAWAYDVKDPYGLYYVFILTPEGIPMLKDGTASPNWKLIEAAISVDNRREACTVTRC